MSENSSVNNNDFRFELSRVSKMAKDDYKANKKEKFIYNTLLKNFQNSSYVTVGFQNFFALLDQEKGTKGVITKEDINIFLSSKEVQKKKITEEDVINFLNKVKDLNPTDIERVYSHMNFVDENNNKVLNDDLSSLFGLNFVKDSDLKDENGNIKKGFEIFDLNGDGKFDGLEQGYFKTNDDEKRGYKQLNSFLHALDNSGSPTGKADGVITAEDKQNVYNNLPLKLFNELKAVDIKDDSGKQVVTPEILALFDNGVTDVKFDDMLDSNGLVKQGFELFDLNGDGKLDDLEKSYFSSGGHAISDDASALNLQRLLYALENFDKFGASGEDLKKYDKTDGLIRKSNSTNLYRMLTSSKYLLDTINNSQDVFPDDITKLFKKAFKEVRLGEIKTERELFKKCAGIHINDFIAVDFDSLDKFEISSILFHELTHHVLTNDKNLKTRMLQEIEAFYIQYKLYNIEKNNPEYNEAKKKQSALQRYYFYAADTIKKENPDISEKDLAIETFLKINYRNYKNNYPGENYTPDQLRALAKKTNNFVML